MLAHRHAGTRLGHAGKARLQFAERKPVHCCLELVGGTLRPIDREQALLHRAAVNDRHIARRIAAAGDAGIDLSGRDLVGDDDRVVERSTASARGGDARRGRRKPRGQRRLTCQVPVCGKFNHGTESDFAEFDAVQVETLDQSAQGFHRHAEIADIGICGVVAAKRDADSAQNGNAFHHAQLRER